jgi:hemolysin activation/secretion protein
LLKSIRPSHPAIYFLRGLLVAPPHASIMTKTPEESKLKIETLAEAQKKMQELLSDPKLKHSPEQSPEGIVLLDKNNKLHQELE